MAIHDWLFHKRTWNNLLFLLCLFLFFGFTFPPASFLFFYPPCLPSFKYISPLGCKPLEGKGILLTPSLQCWASSCKCSPNSAECEHQATFLPFLPSLPWTHTRHSREQFKLSGHEPVWRVIATQWSTGFVFLWNKHAGCRLSEEMWSNSNSRISAPHVCVCVCVWCIYAFSSEIWVTVFTGVSIKNQSYIKRYVEGFPGGSVVKSLAAKAGETGLIPALGRSQVPWSN